MTMTLNALDATAKQVDGWLSDAGGRFLLEHAPTRMAGLKRLLVEVKRSVAPERRELPICFLGNAGVGKSTLINSLIDPFAQVVPQGGVGPLTAQATVVRYSDRPYLRAKYYGARRLNQLTFALDRIAERRQRRAAAEDSVGLDNEDRDEIIFAIPTDADASDEARQVAEGRARSYISQARLLVTGNQYGEESDDEVVYLADALRAVMGRPPLWGFKLRAADVIHVGALREALALGEEGKFVSEADDQAAFLREIRAHATGSIAPLIKSLEVGWRSAVLEPGIVLVDLPGVGVANDEYRTVTSEWIRRASAVVLIVDRAGVTEASAELLRSTGFLNTLLHRDPESTQVSPLLWVVAVKLDDVARDERTSFKQQNPTDKLPRWIEFFQLCCGRAKGLIRNQLDQEFDKAAAATPEALRSARREAQQRILDKLGIHTVSAPEYRKFHAQDDDDRALIGSAEESNIPALAESMRSLGAQHTLELTSAATEALTEILASIARGIQGTIDSLETDARQGQRADALRTQLASLIEPKKTQLSLRQGQLRERLRSTIPATIESEVQRGIGFGTATVHDYLQTLRATHWATLRATIRRGGVRVGRRNIDLPNELALRFEEPLALIWNRAVVSQMKAAIQDFAKSLQSVLDAITLWAESPEAGLDAAKIKRYQEDIRAELGRLSELGNSVAESMRERAKQQLHETLEKTIRDESQRFVESGRDRGTGVSIRVQEFLQETVRISAKVATEEATKFLLATYQRVVTVVTEEFTRLADPVAQAQTLLIGTQQEQDKASQEQRRAQAAALRDLLATVPSMPAEAR